jgi:hypothetical protein
VTSSRGSAYDCSDCSDCAIIQGAAEAAVKERGRRGVRLVNGVAPTILATRCEGQAGVYDHFYGTR